MDYNYKEMSEEEALEILHKEWPEWDEQTEINRQDGSSLVHWLSILESFA